MDLLKKISELEKRISLLEIQKPLYDKLEINFEMIPVKANETDLLVFYTKVPIPNNQVMIIHDQILDHFKKNNVNIPFMVVSNELEFEVVKERK